MTANDNQYETLLRDILYNGAEKGDRTGTGTRSVFGRQLRYDLSQGFPLITTKFVPLRLIAVELIWFLNGNTNIEYLVQNNVSIWTEWPFKAYLLETGQEVPEVNSDKWNEGLAEFSQRIKTDPDFAAKYGDAGPIYGHQWRSWPTPDGRSIDQVQQILDTLNTNSDSRRMIVSAWNVADIEEMAKAGLPPCHTMFQFYVADGKLSCQLYQRSADMFLGVPFNIASYSLLVHMLAQQTGLTPGDFIWTGGDCHIYNNHIDQVRQQIYRRPYLFPRLKLNKRESLFDYEPEDIKTVEYVHYPALKGEVAV